MSEQYTPIPGHLLTRWAKDIDPECPLPEYPRPQMVRDNWLNLNGLWDYAVVPKEQATVTAFTGQILVPFCLESALSGVKKPLLPEERLWYRRTFTIPADWQGKRVLLHFGAVDWETTVLVNGQAAGQHVGGYTPFTCDITNLLTTGENELVVTVWDPTSDWQQYGKQSLDPFLVFYTAVSGIWQTVWLEAVPEQYITDFRLTPDIDRGELAITVQTNTDEPYTLRATAFSAGEALASITGEPGQTLVLPVEDAHRWSPDDPFLYDLTIELLAGETTIDQVDSYFGMRKFSIIRDEKGVNRLGLNNAIVFQNGPLDQGYWPDGLYTAPTDEALKFDVIATKQLGFNMTRKHIKVEPARWYYWCDQVGLIVWQDMINGGRAPKTKRDLPRFMSFAFRRFQADDNERRYKQLNRSDSAARQDFERELNEMLAALYNVPSIGVWVPFNEGWGQFDAARITNTIRAYDSTRIIDHASGYLDQGVSDVQSHHVYFSKLKMPKIVNDRAFVLSEYGGYGCKVNGHLWSDAGRAYKTFATTQELAATYDSLIREQVMPLVEQGCCAIIYTQLTDVENEINGFYSYDRAVLKIGEEQLRALHQALYDHAQT